MAKLNTGDKLPSFTFDTHLRDGLGSLSVLRGKTVFWVLRYIGCTVCRYDVHLIAQRYDEFTAKGAQVFVVMQSDRDHVQKDLAATDTVLPFEIICDPDQKIYDLLSIEPAESMEALAGGNRDALMEKGAKRATAASPTATTKETSSSSPPCSSWQRTARWSTRTTPKTSWTCPLWTVSSGCCNF